MTNLAQALATWTLVLMLPLPGVTQGPLPGFDSPIVVQPSGVIELAMDADADGFTDLLVLTVNPPLVGSTTLTLNRNLGNGTFAQSWQAQAGAQFTSTLPYAKATAANLNGGLSLDFVVHTQTTATAFSTNGLLPPTPLLIYTGGTFVESVHPADLNADGLDELLIADFNGIVSVVTINPGFTTATSLALPTGLAIRRSAALPLGVGSWALAVVDASNVLTLLVLNSVGSIVSSTPLGTVLPGIRNIAAGDVDGDLDRDFVLFAAGSLYQVLRQGIGGSFTLEPVQSGGPASDLVDVDGDGDLDGVGCTLDAPQPLSQWVDFQTSSIEISLNDGTGGFGPASRIASIGGNGPAPIADFNNDGRLDIAGGRAIYFGSGSLGSPIGTRFPPLPFGDPRPWLSRDLEGDGDIDLEASPIGAAINDGSGRFSTLITSIAGLNPATIDGYSPIDHDGDGDTDFLVRAPAGAPAGSQFLYTLTQVSPYQFVAGPPMAAVGAGHLTPNADFRSYDIDMDGDGRKDLIITTEITLALPVQTDRTTIYRNLGNGVFAPPASFALTLKGIGDFDQDGLPDTVLHNVPTGFAWSLLWSRNMGSMNFALPVVVGSGFGQHQYRNVVVTDIDRNGTIDILAPSYPQIPFGLRVATAYLNNGVGVFTPVPNLLSTPPTLALDHLYAADFDGDGFTDYVERLTPLLPGSFAPTARYYPGTGGGNHGAPVEYVLSSNVIGDVNGDGPADVVNLSYGRTQTFHLAPVGFAGSYSQFGINGTGASGAIPVLGARGPFRALSTVEVRFRGGPPSAAALFGIAGGLLTTPQTLAPGHELYLDLTQPNILVPMTASGILGVPGSGRFDITFLIPPGIQGVTLYHHAAFGDATIPGGIGTSNAFVVTYGG